MTLEPDEVERVHDELASAGRKELRDVHAREDALQEAWVILLGAGAPLAARPAGWYRLVVRNVARSALRAQRRRQDREALASRREELDEDHGRALVRDELAALLAREVGALDPEVGDAIHARIVSGLSYEELAARTGVGAATLRSRVHRGLARLRARLERHAPDLAPALAVWSREGPTPEAAATLARALRRLPPVPAGAKVLTGGLALGLAALGLAALGLAGVWWGTLFLGLRGAPSVGSAAQPIELAAAGGPGSGSDPAPLRPAAADAERRLPFDADAAVADTTEAPVGAAADGLGTAEAPGRVLAVVDAHGAPAAHAEAYVLRGRPPSGYDGAPLPAEADLVADETGRLVLPPLAAGASLLVRRGPEFALLGPPRDARTYINLAWARDSVALEPPEDWPATVALAPCVDVAFRVVDPAGLPIDGAWVAVTGERFTLRRDRRPNGLGLLTLDLVPVGVTVVLDVGAPGFGSRTYGPFRVPPVGGVHEVALVPAAPVVFEALDADGDPVGDLALQVLQLGSHELLGLAPLAGELPDAHRRLEGASTVEPRAWRFPREELAPGDYEVRLLDRERIVRHESRVSVTGEAGQVVRLFVEHTPPVVELLVEHAPRAASERPVAVVLAEPDARREDLRGIPLTDVLTRYEGPRAGRWAVYDPARGPFDPAAALALEPGTHHLAFDEAAGFARPIEPRGVR